MIPKFGMFFLKNDENFKSYASAKIIPDDNLTGEFAIELGHIPGKESVMAYFENRTLVDDNGHRSSKQSLKLGYITENSIGIGGNLELSELGDENVKLNLIAGIFFGVYKK